MVNSKDLRLGNLVRIDLEDENDDLTPYLNHVAKVRSVDEYSIKIGIIDDMILISCNFGQGINPIPLTKNVFHCIKNMAHDDDEEVEGFIHEAHGANGFEFYLDQNTSNYNLYARNFGGDDLVTKTKQIVYLHELQNLYFALTGKELEINLEKLKKIKNVDK